MRRKRFGAIPPLILQSSDPVAEACSSNNHWASIQNRETRENHPCICFFAVKLPETKQLTNSGLRYPNSQASWMSTEEPLLTTIAGVAATNGPYREIFPGLPSVWDEFETGEQFFLLPTLPTIPRTNLAGGPSLQPSISEAPDNRQNGGGVGWLHTSDFTLQRPLNEQPGALQRHDPPEKNTGYSEAIARRRPASRGLIRAALWTGAAANRNGNSRISWGSGALDRPTPPSVTYKR